MHIAGLLVMCNKIYLFSALLLENILLGIILVLHYFVCLTGFKNVVCFIQRVVQLERQFYKVMGSSCPRILYYGGPCLID